MQIEHLDNHMARLTVEVPNERLESAMQKAARRIAGKVNIPGFRKGKAPFGVVVQYVGQQAVMEEAIDELGNQVYREALDEAKLEPYAPGNLEEVKTEPPLTLVFTVAKQPEVELSDYRAFRLPYEEATVTDEQVDETLKRMRDQRAVVETVERPAAMSDVVKAKLFGEVVHPAGEGEHAHDEQPEGEKAESAEPEEPKAEAEPHVETFIDQETDILLSEDKDEEFMPGFSAQLVGLSAGDHKEFSLAFGPEEEDKRYAGHTFNYRIDVIEVKSRLLPDLNDEFAATLNAETPTLLELRMQVRKDLQDALTRETDSKYADQVLEALSDQATVRYPEAMVDEYTDDILQELDQNLRERGLSLEQLKTIQKKDDAALRAEYRDAAIRRIIRALTLREIVAQEKLEVSTADIDAHIDRLAAQFSDDEKQVATFRRMLGGDEYRRSLSYNMVMDRVRQRIVAIARGENPPVGLTEATFEMPVAEQQISFGAAPESSGTASGETGSDSAERAPDQPAETPQSGGPSSESTGQ